MPLAERRDGASCGELDCPRRYMLLQLHGSATGMQRAAAQQFKYDAGTVRYFVELELDDALIVDARACRELSFELLRNQDRAALALLCAFEQHGVTAIHLKRGGDAVLLLFTRSIGKEVTIRDDAPYELDTNGVWHRQAPAPRRGQQFGGRFSSMRRRALHAGGRSPRTFIRELVLALACFMLAPPLAPMIESDARIPVWALVLGGLGLLSLVDLIVQRAVRLAKAGMTAAHARTDERLRALELQVADGRRDLSARIDDLMGPPQRRSESPLGGDDEVPPPSEVS